MIPIRAANADLGERLIEILAHKLERRKRAEKSDVNERRLKLAAEQRRTTFITFFEGVKKDIAICIDAGEAPNPYMLPAFPIFPSGDNVDSPHHPDNAVYLQFTEWLTKCGLKGRVTLGNDGVGMRSWHSLYIMPLRRNPNAVFIIVRPDLARPELCVREIERTELPKYTAKTRLNEFLWSGQVFTEREVALERAQSMAHCRGWQVIEN